MQNETLIIEESHARERVDKVIAEMMEKVVQQYNSC